MMDLFINTELFTSQDFNSWTGVVSWIIVIIVTLPLSAVRTLILMAPIHFRGSIGEQVIQC